MARARIATMLPLLMGKDPLTIEVHFHQMTTLMHTYMAHIPTIRCKMPTAINATPT